MKRILYLIPLIAIFCACQQANEIESNDAKIYLSASIVEAIETRGAYTSTTPTANDVLRATVWATNTGTYIGRGLSGRGQTGDLADVVDIHATANFDSGDPKLLNEAVYPKSGKEVAFIGLHPNRGWNTKDEDEVDGGDGKIAEFTFNGSQDVMFAPKVTGQYASDDETIRVLELNFKHMLTWLKIKIKAENEMAAKSWGKIQSIEIKSNDKVSINLMQTYDFSTCVEFSGEEDNRLPLYKVGTDEVFPGSEGFELTNTEYKEEAYVLCEPVVGQLTHPYDGPTYEYTLHIKTERREVDLPIDLMKNSTECFEGSTRAKHFTLNLNFMVGNIVMIESEVNDWEFGESIDVDVDF